MAGYSGISMSNNAVQAYDEGKRPLSRITKEDIQKYGISESITFFRWFVQKHCHPCEWHHHSSPKFNMTDFYDVESCCTRLKKWDIDQLKSEYKNRPKPKPDMEIDNDPYYAKVEYSISTFSGRRKYIEAYAIIHRYWAYIKDDYLKEVTRKKISGGHFWITEKYESRPEEMPEEVVSEIMTVMNKKKV
jgi:hypothetical protein